MADHSPRQLDRYRAIHEAAMQRFRNLGFVLHDGLAFDKIGGGMLSLEGAITCIDGLAIDVEKYLNVLDGEGPTSMVQTFAYTYNAHVDGIKDANIFRYCSEHDHRPHHHRHQYDVFGTMKEEQRSPAVLVDADWPTLGKVIEELMVWHGKHAESLKALRARFGQ